MKTTLKLLAQQPPLADYKFNRAVHFENTVFSKREILKTGSARSEGQIVTMLTSPESP